MPRVIYSSSSAREEGLGGIWSAWRGLWGADPYENHCGVCAEGAVLGRRGGSWGPCEWELWDGAGAVFLHPTDGAPITFGSPTNDISRGVGMQCACVEMYLYFPTEWSHSQGCRSSRNVWTTL